MVSPHRRMPSPAMNSRTFMALSTSPRASRRILPSSRVSARASSSLRSPRIRSARSRTRPRSGPETRRQPFCALTATSTAARASSRVESRIVPIRSEVLAGFRFGISSRDLRLDPLAAHEVAIDRHRRLPREAAILPVPRGSRRPPGVRKREPPGRSGTPAASGDHLSVTLRAARGTWQKPERRVFRGSAWPAR